MCMPDPFWSARGFGMKDGVDIVRLSDFLGDELEGHDIVGRWQGVVMTEIYFMLAVRNFMMRGNDIDPHVLKGQDRLPAEVDARSRGVRSKYPPLSRISGFVNSGKKRILSPGRYKR